MSSLASQLLARTPTKTPGTRRSRFVRVTVSPRPSKPTARLTPLPGAFAETDDPPLPSRRKLGGTVSIVGNDVDEEVVSRDVPVSTPVMKAKPLRAPLRERTNKTPAADSRMTRVVNETDAEASATNAERATPDPEKAEAAISVEPEKPPAREEPPAPEPEEATASKPEAPVESDAAERARLEGVRLMREGLARMCARGVDPAEAILSLCANPARPNAREAASTVVKRLVASLDAEAKAEVKAVEEEDAEAGPPAAAADPGDPEAATRVLRDSRKRSVVESLSSAPRLARERDGENLSDEDEDVFATAPPSPMGSVASANGGSAGNEKNENENVSAPALAAALAAARAPAARVTAETYIVEEGVLGCGDAACGEDGASCGDPVACLTKRFAAVGGPFKLPGVQIPRIDRTASTAASPPEADPPLRAEEDEADETNPSRDDASCDLSSCEDESEAGESVAGTEEDDDDARTGEDEDDERDSVADTASAAGTERDDDDEADVCQLANAAAEAFEAEAFEAEETLAASPGPEVVDVAELPGGTPVTASPSPPADLAAAAQEEAAEDSDSDSDGPVSVRKRHGRRVVLSDDEEEEVAAESSGESPDPPPKATAVAFVSPAVAESTPPASPAPATPPAAPAFTPAPPTTGKKKSMLRLKSAAKPARGPARPDFDFTDDASAASDATRDAHVAAATSAASSAALTRAPSFPKSALKKPRETVPRTEAEAGEDSPARRPRRRATARGSAVASAREKALTWLDDEASADGDESDDEASADGGDESDDDFVVGDDEVEYASDASEAAIADDIRARSGGIMPNADAVRDRPRGARAERGVTFVSPSAAIDAVELSGDEAEQAETRGGALKEAKTEPADPYCLDGLRTPTPPRALLANPYNPKTPKSAIGRKPGGGAYAGFGEAPPTHSKALAAALASAAKPGKRLNFARHKETVAAELYREFNRDGFGGALPERFEITWNAKLLTTAGLTHYRKVTRSSGVSEYHARIELSTKVLDTAEKLEATLLHEMCHAAAWLLDRCAKPPHGSVFKKWAERAMRAYPVVRVDTCHSYQIHQPYKYRCTQSWCLQEYGRHSKSIDVAAKACGVCNGALEFLGKFNADGTKAEEKKATAFSLFVKEHFGSVKERLPAGTPHKLVMQELSARWKSGGGTEKKTRAGDADAAGALEGMRALKLG